MHRHHKEFTAAGKPLEEAQAAMIMLHGRGASPESILEVSRLLPVEAFALIAPRATANSWYPYSFMAPSSQNEPGLSTGLGVISQLVTDIEAAGIAAQNLFFLGFSQGACLTAEYLARNGRHYGGAFLYSGGLIGPQLDKTPYQGDFGQSPILLGCSDTDAHVPLHRIKETTAVFSEMGAQVSERIYPNGPHTIYKDEIEQTRDILLRHFT